MNTSTHHHGSRVGQRETSIRKFGPLVLIAGSIIAVCAGVSFAQSSIVTTALPTEDASSRPRRLTTEEANKDMTAHTERRIFVRSKSLLVGRAVVEDKLIKRSEFKQLGFAITREGSDADLILELRHDLFTMYVFTVFDAKTGVVLLSGKLSSLGGTVAGKVAKRFVKEMPASLGP
jgi:hypothetical protein